MTTWRHTLNRIALRMISFIEATATERAGGLEAFVSGSEGSEYLILLFFSSDQRVRLGKLKSAL